MLPLTNEQKQKRKESSKKHSSLDLPNCPCAVHNGRKSRLGSKPSEETKRKISESNMGKEVSLESRKKISDTRNELFLQGKLSISNQYTKKKVV